jgi:hypothetical protein
MMQNGGLPLIPRFLQPNITFDSDEELDSDDEESEDEEDESRDDSNVFDKETDSDDDDGNDERMKEQEQKGGWIPFFTDTLCRKSRKSHFRSHFDDDEDEDIEKKELWISFFTGTLCRVRKALQFAYLGILSVYLTIIIRCFRHRKGGASRLVGKMSLIHAAVLFLSWRGLRRVSNTSWARNIKKAKRFATSKHVIAKQLKGTIPILDDMRSDYLFSFENVLETFQPGNLAFHGVIQSRSLGYGNLTPPLQQELCESILRWSRQQGRRVLAKNTDNNWAVSDPDWALRYCHKEMLMTTSSRLREAITKLDYLIAETKYGYWRNTILHSKHIPLFLVDLQDAIMRPRVDYGKIPPLLSYLSGDHVSHRPAISFTPQTVTKTLPPRQLIQRSSGRSNLLSQEQEVGPPFPQAWLQEGDVVDASDLDEPMQCK